MSLLTLWTLSGGVGIVGIRSSSGAHRLHPALSVHAGHTRGALSFEAELAAASWQEGRLASQTRNSMLRPAVLVGSYLGDGPTRVGGMVGPAAVVFVGEEGTLVRPGLRLRGDLNRALGERGLVSLRMGWTQRGQSGDVDLGLQAGVRW